MAGDTTLTVVGNLTADPELRFTATGTPVANFTVASTPRSYDKQSGEWKDGEALFLRCTIWRDAAENVAESLTRGARVIVTGRLKQRSYDTTDSENRTVNRTVIELDAEEVGPSLRWAAATVRKANRGSDTPTSARANPAGDPWGTPAARPPVGAGAGVPGFTDEPPF